MFRGTADCTAQMLRSIGETMESSRAAAALGTSLAFTVQADEYTHPERIGVQDTAALVAPVVPSIFLPSTMSPNATTIFRGPTYGSRA